MFTVKTTFYSGLEKVNQIRDDEITDGILANLEVIAMNGYHNVASIEVTKDGKVVMYGEN